MQNYSKIEDNTENLVEGFMDIMYHALHIPWLHCYKWLRFTKMVWIHPVVNTGKIYNSDENMSVIVAQSCGSGSDLRMVVILMVTQKVLRAHEGNLVFCGYHLI